MAIRGIGRPLKYSSADEIQPLIDAYFADCDRDGKPYTIAGLAYALDCSRDTIYEYEDNTNKPFSDSIKKARARVLTRLEEGIAGDKGNPAGKIFLAKNYGYSDRQGIDIATPQGIQFDLTGLSVEDLRRLADKL